MTNPRPLTYCIPSTPLKEGVTWTHGYSETKACKWAVLVPTERKGRERKEEKTLAKDKRLLKGTLSFF